MTMINLSILSMCWWRKNIIVMLMSLEMLLISLYFHFSNYIFSTSLPSLMIMLLMMVSGSSMGLSLLISLSNSHNSSNSNFINMMTFVKNFPYYFFNFIIKFFTFIIYIFINYSPSSINLLSK